MRCRAYLPVPNTAGVVITMTGYEEWDVNAFVEIAPMQFIWHDTDDALTPAELQMSVTVAGVTRTIEEWGMSNALTFEIMDGEGDYLDEC